MSAHIAKITSKAQTTLPKAVRAALGVGPGDSLIYTVTDRGVMVKRAETIDWAYLKSAEAGLGEWHTAEDAAAFDDL